MYSDKEIPLEEPNLTLARDYFTAATNKGESLVDLLKKDLFFLSAEMGPEAVAKINQVLALLNPVAKQPGPATSYQHLTDEGNLIFNKTRRMAKSPFKKDPIQLTPYRALILELLMQNPQAVISTEQIFQARFGNDYQPSNDESDRMKSHVHFLRRDLGDTAQGPDHRFRLIYNLPDIGYSLTKSVLIDLQAIATTTFIEPDQDQDLIKFQTAWGDLVFNSSRGTVYSPFKRGETIILTRAEAICLNKLMLNPKRVMTNLVLAQARNEQTGGDAPLPFEINAIKIHIWQIRKALGDSCIKGKEGSFTRFRLIHTGRGTEPGYFFDPNYHSLAKAA